ncbi:hypothetical protein P364_0132155 [Paenibacillus sp. MAEPY2]|nr:hypothetical protein P364_0132155 [Paenibacillus sp. MAEPY2]KGP77976.1 hypothetical protein P363_0132775 [Paenibacillus sp. MAEPY1]OZQ62841.1 hypothetical protein CA599_25620 [Paenibacillus taichungensis]SFT00168.1 hypothetical protein SAMN04488601_1184 [Paenibacillus sp. 453mf]
MKEVEKSNDYLIIFLCENNAKFIYSSTKQVFFRQRNTVYEVEYKILWQKYIFWEDFALVFTNQEGKK